MDISTVRNAYLSARVEVNGVIGKVMEDFFMPDELIKLAMMNATMPPEARALLDAETQGKIKEVLNGK